MATFEDLHPDQDHTLWGLRMDMGRMAENVRDLIATWRKNAQDGIDPRERMPLVANALLGRLKRAYDFFQEQPTELTRMSGKVGMTAQEITDALIVRRDALRTFRDATKANLSQTKAAVDALAAAFPNPKTPSATEKFLARPLPVTW